jgi:hypothetical protein
VIVVLALEKEAEGSVLNIVRERVRRMNSSSCADIDPMSMDQSVGFDQVGGLRFVTGGSWQL